MSMVNVSNYMLQDETEPIKEMLTRNSRFFMRKGVMHASRSMGLRDQSHFSCFIFEGTCSV